MASLDEEWVRLLREAYLIARGERMAELRGRRLKRFDDQGLHPFSVVIGKLTMIESMLGLPGEVCVHPLHIRSAAVKDAHKAFAKELREGDDDPWT